MREPGIPELVRIVEGPPRILTQSSYLVRLCVLGLAMWSATAREFNERNLDLLNHREVILAEVDGLVLRLKLKSSLVSCSILDNSTVTLVGSLVDMDKLSLVTGLVQVVEEEPWTFLGAC